MLIPISGKMSKLSREQILNMRTNCVATNLRRATRIVIRIYEEQFRDSDITAAQFSIFALLGLHNEMSGSMLAAELNADLSTITRNMEALELKSFVEKKNGADKRVKIYTLTKKGRTALQNAVPLWQTAQSTILTLIGNESWEPLRQTLKKLEDDS
jgi:DNA-binding MarR family transcriptional regulator